MVPTVVLWILAVAGCLSIGREVSKLRAGKSRISKPYSATIGEPLLAPLVAPITKLHEVKRDALALAIRLREVGLKQVPACLEDLAVGEVGDMFQKIHELATTIRAGNDAILKELEGTYDRVLGAKLRSPEGRAVIRARLLEAEKITKVAAKLAPVAEVAALALI